MLKAELMSCVLRTSFLINDKWYSACKTGTIHESKGTTQTVFSIILNYKRTQKILKRLLQKVVTQ